MLLLTGLKNLCNLEKSVNIFRIYYYYRVVKQIFQVVRFRDFEHMRARMALTFSVTSRHNIYLLNQSKKLIPKAKTSPES